MTHTTTHLLQPKAVAIGTQSALLSHDVDKEQIDFKPIHLLSLLSLLLLFLLEMVLPAKPGETHFFLPLLYAGVEFTGLFRLA